MAPRKIAVFVEGQTEQLFVERLFQEIAGYKNLSIETYKFIGGKTNIKIALLNKKLVENPAFFVLLYNCGSESNVVSDIKKQHTSLTNNGYEKIIGIRDLYPKPLETKEALEKGIEGNLKNSNISGVKTSVIIAIMEIEAWFLAEWHYFSKIDITLSSDFIKQQCGLDLKTIDIEQIPHPSKILNDIYGLVGKRYDKTEQNGKEVINFIDYEFLYLHLVHRVGQLKKLIDEIDVFLS